METKQTIIFLSIQCQIIPPWLNIYQSLIFIDSKMLIELFAQAWHPLYPWQLFCLLLVHILSKASGASNNSCLFQNWFCRVLSILVQIDDTTKGIDVTSFSSISYCSNVRLISKIELERDLQWSVAGLIFPVWWFKLSVRLFHLGN